KENFFNVLINNSHLPPSNPTAFSDKHHQFYGGSECNRSGTPFGTTSTSASTSTRAHSVAYYLSMPRLDRFLSWTHLCSNLAFYILPLAWIAVAIGWIVYLRKRNTYLKYQ